MMPRGTVRHLICGLLAVAFVWLAAPMGAAAAAPEHLVSYYTYDAPSYDAPTTHTALERGPPVQSLDHAVVAPGHRWSPGASVRLDAGSIAAITTYAHHEMTAQGARTVTTPGGHVVLTHGDSSPHAQAGVAAKAEVPTVVFSRSRAPGIAGTFDDAVANGAPTQLNRVGAAARDANRRAALRGQSPAPAGQSLDEYPFACSAQGGCGATVRSVPVGEQSYQGGVLSRFFQDNGVGVGHPFNVMFGP